MLLADESVCIGPPSSAKSYLNIPAVISAAEVTGAAAIHPVTVFSQKMRILPNRWNAQDLCLSARKRETIRLMGDKVSAIQAMKQAGVPCVTGFRWPAGR